MSAYDRINNVITELPPESAFKVFEFIKSLFDNRLDKQFFKDTFWSFNVAEQHYVCYYTKTYFDSSDRYTFFNKWIQEKGFEYSKAGEEQSFFDFKEELYQNRRQLVSILISYEKTAQRRLKQLKKFKVPFNQYSDYFPEGQIDYRIPLYFKPNKFKNYFLDVMNEVMSVEQAEEFFYNSFKFGNNLYDIKLLYIELNDLTLIKEQLSLVKREYDNHIKYQLEKLVLTHNGKIDTKPDKKQIWYSKLTDDKPTLTDFAKIMYNAFPQLRDTASKHKKGLDQFLTSYGSNLVIRD